MIQSRHVNKKTNASTPSFDSENFRHTNWDRAEKRTGHPLCKLAFLKFLEGCLNRILEHKNLVENQQRK